MRTTTVIVSGTVQGVGFRVACLQTAQSRDVTGWVRNLSDGTVEAVFSGAEDDVTALIDWCHHGPGRAEVDRVDTRDLERDEVADLPETFEVR
ncbi:acylphosphatase [Citricoccus sp. GCM10030269]|uniref:acylphosphatase n=1 Tax=Citricoccus sp. GCM10030269 TaxID=3273388 RepID=UPI00361B2C5A